MEGALHGGDRSVGAGRKDLDAPAAGLDESLSPQVPLDESNGGVIEMGEVGEGALLDFAVLATGLPQELRDMDPSALSRGDEGDVHALGAGHYY